MNPFVLTWFNVCRHLGINANMLGRWIQEFRADDSEAFRGNGRRTVARDELRRLREENRRLKQERDILVKAAAFFAKEVS